MSISLDPQLVDEAVIVHLLDPSFAIDPSFLKAVQAICKVVRILLSKCRLRDDGMIHVDWKNMRHSTQKV